MAVLAPADLAELRERFRAGGQVVDFTKPQINAALQACEDWFETNKASLAAAIIAAGTAAGKTFTAAQARRIATQWLAYKLRVGVS